MSLWKTTRVFLILVLASCGVLNEKVTLTNSATTKVTEVRLEAAGQEIWTGQLDAGTSTSISFQPTMDGSLEVTGKLNGQPIQSGPKGYVTPNGGQSHKLTIQSDGSVTYN